MDGGPANELIPELLTAIATEVSSTGGDRAPREEPSWEETRLREHLLRKEEHRAFLQQRKSTCNSAQRGLSSLAIYLAQTINDLALQARPEDRWTPAWENRFSEVWRELFFRESVHRLMRQSMHIGPREHTSTLAENDLSDAALALPRLAPPAFEDKRCFAFIFRAIKQVRFSENGSLLIWYSKSDSQTLFTLTEEGAALIALLRRMDPSGRRSMALYRTWTQSRDRRKNSSLGTE